MKKLLLWLICIGVIFFLSTKISTGIQSKVLYISDGVKIGIFNFYSNISNFIKRHFDQAAQIKYLSNELKSKQQAEYSLEALTSEYNQLLNSVQSYLQLDLPEVTLVRTISYIELNDYKKVWLELKSDKTYEEGQIFGLIDNNRTAGIAVYSNNRLIGYLNGADKCSYSVIIGEYKMPGVVKYDTNRGFIVDYIPLQQEIKAGDKIYTSGYDGIFYPNIYVGEVSSVDLSQGYQIALIKAVESETARFYWLIDTESFELFPAEDNNQTDSSPPPLFISPIIKN